jgi:hypothetical protein
MIEIEVNDRKSNRCPSPGWQALGQLPRPTHSESDPITTVCKRDFQDIQLPGVHRILPTECVHKRVLPFSFGGYLSLSILREVTLESPDYPADLALIGG